MNRNVVAFTGLVLLAACGGQDSAVDKSNDQRANGAEVVAPATGPTIDTSQSVSDQLENQADSVRENAKNQAEAIEENADRAADQAKQAAKQTKERGEAAAEALEKQADQAK